VIVTDSVDEFDRVDGAVIVDVSDGAVDPDVVWVS
jgi:hypothetical protein